MLPAAARMRRRAEFTATVRGGRRVGGPALVVHYRPAPDVAVPRVGFVVGRTVGTAAVRNRLRRRLRHLLRDRLGSLPVGSTLVIRANPAAVAMTSGELAEQVDRALARATEGQAR